MTTKINTVHSHHIKLLEGLGIARVTSRPYAWQGLGLPDEKRYWSPSLSLNCGNGCRSRFGTGADNRGHESAQVLQYLGISRATLDRYGSSGKIPTCQLSPRGRRFFRKSDIDAALSSQPSAAEPRAVLDFIHNRIGRGAP